MKPNVSSKTTSGMASLSSLPDLKSSAADSDIPDDVLSLNYMKDPSPGPLDAYRKRASFDWKKMRMFLDGEDILRYKVTVIK